MLQSTRQAVASTSGRVSGPSRSVVARCSSKPSRSDELQQLAAFQAGVRAQLGGVDLSRPRSPSPSAAVVATVNVVTAEEPAGPSSSAAAAGKPAGLLELNAETFWPHIESAGDNLVVVDFFTDWCGPCKLIYPELVAMSQELAPSGVQVVKFNCNQANKELAKVLNIRVAPTFHLYRGGTKLGELTGAKVDKLRSMIAEALAGPQPDGGGAAEANN